jgi:ubiquinone/menaquinone biosynthesis C-methylase UbiE
MNAHMSHTSLPVAGFAHPATNINALGIEPGMLIADFGAGSGAYVLPIAQVLAKSGRVYAIDVQKDLLRRIHTEARKRGLDHAIEFIWGDLEAAGGSKIADQKLDLVLVSNLLFQVPDKDALLREARRILKPTGRLAIIDWSESFGGLGPRQEDVVGQDAALSLAHRNGFELLREFHAGAHHYGLLLHIVALKPHSHHVVQKTFQRINIAV